MAVIDVETGGVIGEMHTILCLRREKIALIRRRWRGKGS